MKFKKKYKWQERERHFMVLNMHKSMKVRWEEVVFSERPFIARITQGINIYTGDKFKNPLSADRDSAHPDS